MEKQPSEFKEIPLSGKLAEFREALNDEIKKIKTSGSSSTILRSGCPLETNGKGYWYRFVVEYAPALPADTPCKLKIDNKYYDVSVVSVEENIIIVASDNSLPDNIGYAQLENGSTVLMERLIKCIEENAEKSNPVGDRMLTPDDSVYIAKKIHSYDDLQLKKSNTESQSTAIIEALSNDITYIWGPPGTGKTTVIGQIIDELYKHDRSVLVVSHTNTAVDGAIEKADDSYSASHKNQSEKELYPILRLGTPARTITKKALIENHIKELGKELFEKKVSLENEQNSIQEDIRNLDIILNKSSWLQSSKLEEASLLLKDYKEKSLKCEELNGIASELKQRIEEYNKEHPEIAEYRSISEHYSSVQEALTYTSDRLIDVNDEVARKKNNIRKAEDEIRKYDKYSRMQSFRNTNFMSEEFYREQIQTLRSQISEKNSNIDILLNEKKSVEDQVTSFEGKSSIGKFFSSSTEYTKNKNRLDEINEQIKLLQEEAGRIDSVEKAQHEKLDSLLKYTKEMELYIPSNDKATWTRLLQKYQSELNSLTDELRSLVALKSSIEDELLDLTPKLENAKIAFEKSNELQQLYNQANGHLDEVRRISRNLQESARQIIDAELMACASFYKADIALLNNSLEDICDNLQSLYIHIQEELVTIDINTVVNEKESLSERSKEIASILADINKMLSDLERQAIMNAKIIGTTLAKSYLDSTLRERTFDTVILDEASMASIPALWCASYLADTSIIIVGDFLQLPPIVMADTDLAKKWLGTDIFYLSGMQERAKNSSTCPRNFVMLNDQFRMESDIANIANMYYGQYGGLQSNDNNEIRNKLRCEFHKWYKRAIPNRHVHLINTESLGAWASAIPQGNTKSRLNTFSATVDVDLAFGFIENLLKEIDPETAKLYSEPKVLIVAPYKAHIKLINKLIDYGYESRGYKDNLGLIRAGTIHSFQGTEAEIVIFDLVIDEPHFKANLFMPDDKEGDTRKLFNVAITRAKFELYIVGDFKFLEKHAKNNALAQLLDMLINKMKLPKIDVKELLPDLVFSRPTSTHFQGDINNCQIICKETEYLDYLKNDISTFKKRMIIFSPFMTERRLADLLPYFVDAINKGKKIVVITKDRSDRKKTELYAYIKCEEELKTIGVDVLHKKGMHEKLVFVDSSAVWVGSLNSLSFTGETGEIMHRLGDRKITEEYEKIYNIPHIDNAVNNKYEQQCPICQGEMLLRDGRDGGFFWSCINGDYTRSMDQQYPLDGMFRCSCGAPYKFSMVKEPRWVCSENPKHQKKKIRLSDLKFEKMYALIPSSERRAVKKYLNEKQAEKAKAEKKKANSKTKKKTGTNKKSTKQNEKRNTPEGEQLSLLDL